MPIFALYNFDDTGTIVNDSALDNGNQFGGYFDGATPSGGRVVLDGINDKAKIYPNPEFEMAQGTLDIQFIQTSHTGTGVNTILSRDSVGVTDAGFRIVALANGAIRIAHESATGGTTTYQTAAGFNTPGNEIHVTYSWDEVSGGRVDIDNLTTSASFTSAVPAGLTMDGGVESQPWIIGAGQSTSDPGALNNIDTYFHGSASVFSLSDTVDNLTTDEPDANPDVAITDEDTAVVIDVLANDTDPNGDTLTIVGVPTASNGTVSVNPDGTITYTPDPDYNGPDTITYVVRDPAGNTDTSTVDVTVTPVNDAPVAVDDSGSTAINTPVTIDILGNDTDADGDTLTTIGTPTSPNGTVVVNGDGTIRFTPTTGFTGTATISYTITDPDGLTDTAVVTVSVGGVAPDANPDTATTDEDTPVTIDVLLNDTDPNGDPLTIVGIPTAPNGTVAVNPDGTITYTPDPDYNGPDTITYTVRDPAGNTDTSTVTVTVNPVNDAPVAEDDSDSTPINTPVTIDILGNDTDVDGDTLSIVGTPTSPDGTVVVNGDGTITFTPTTGFTGPATISYTITDPDGLTDTAVVTVGVGGDDPIANPDTATTDEDTPVTIDVLLNDTDPNGDPLTIVGIPTAPNGTVAVNPDGTITYTPDPDYNGPDTITYVVRDPAGNTDTSTVTVTVNPVNDAPDARDDADVTPFNTPVTIDILANDTDVDGDTLSIVGTPTSPDGTVVVNGDGTITFTPTTGFDGTTSITYTVTDPGGLTDTATVRVIVGDAPVPDGYVDGSAAGELIDEFYTGDPNGDFVDNSDALLPGAAPEDDVIRAGAGDDTILAGLGDDVVTAGPGDDSVFGGVGDDTLYGGDDNDTIDAGSGSDRVEGGEGDDVIISDDIGESLPDRAFPGINAADTDIFDNRDTIYGGGGNDTISAGDDADLIYGGLGDDSIDGGVDDDTIVAGDGNDTIIGGEGSDSIQGNLGDDLIYGGLGAGSPDVINIVDATDPVPDNGRDTIDAGDGNDTVFGLDDADLIYGGTGDDSLDGGIDNDTVVGGFGDDTIIGGLGVDSLYGGGDRDVFLVNTLEEGLGDRIDGGEAGDDFDTLDLRGAGPLRIDYETNPENGTVRFFDADRNVTGTLDFINIENVIPCFTPGTMIATPKGEVLVENLKAGDKVITRDNGIQEIRWTGNKKLSHNALQVNKHLRPIMIRQGSLGNGLPERDMLVSPNHRMLVANDRTALYFDEHEVLVAAKHLIGGKGIFSLDSIGTTYIHFMFDQHEVVLSDGAWSESFQPGDFTLKGMGNAQRNEIFELFPDLRTEAGLGDYIAARRTLKRHEAVLLTR